MFVDPGDHANFETMKPFPVCLQDDVLQAACVRETPKWKRWKIPLFDSVFSCLFYSEQMTR